MKKLMIFAFLISFTMHANAQIPNPGFETLHADGSVANWQPSTFTIFYPDSNCVYQGWDSIQTPTHDAHSGSYAYEIRVATACGDAYSGIIKPNRYDTAIGFFDQRIPISRQPAAFTFYYKLYSAQGDYGVAEAFMENLGGSSTGSGSIQLPATTSWTKAILPMHYTVNDTGGYLRLSFYLKNPSGLHYGTRFLIDDIEQGAPTEIPDIVNTSASLICFPSPAQSSISIYLPEAHTGANTIITITDMAGRIVLQTHRQISQNRIFTIDTRMLVPGVYYIKTIENGTIAMGRFTKI